MLPIDTTKLQFNWPNARAMAEVAAQAYLVLPFRGDGPMPILVSDDKTSAFCFVQDRGDCVVVGIQGSRQEKDFVQDAECWFTDFPDEKSGQVACMHHGFFQDWQALKPRVLEIVHGMMPADPRGKPIFIGGHSLGGAVSLPCAFDLDRAGLTIGGVYTFGQPRVGDKIFAQIYDQVLRDRTFRIVNENDIVPRVPGVLAGYRHCGTEILLFNPVGWGVNPSIWMKLLSDALGLWVAYRKKCDVLITEHFIAAYQSRIQLLK